MKKTFLRIAAVSIFWGACCAVATLSLVPVNELPDLAMSVWDKAQHSLGFAGLGVLGLQAYPKHFSRVCIGLLVFGAAIEVAQSVSGWRTGDAMDWLADAVGIVFAAAIAHRLKQRIA